MYLGTERGVAPRRRMAERPNHWTHLDRGSKIYKYTDVNGSILPISSAGSFKAILASPSRTDPHVYFIFFKYHPAPPEPIFSKKITILKRSLPSECSLVDGVFCSESTLLLGDNFIWLFSTVLYITAHFPDIGNSAIPPTPGLPSSLRLQRLRLDSTELEGIIWIRAFRQHVSISSRDAAGEASAVRRGCCRRWQRPSFIPRTAGREASSRKLQRLHGKRRWPLPGK